jgi:hypothetical protein
LLPTQHLRRDDRRVAKAIAAGSPDCNVSPVARAVFGHVELPADRLCGFVCRGWPLACEVGTVMTGEAAETGRGQIA